MDNRPIGVFDSGLGGLTVVKELFKRLPHESIVYFGDTGRVPYGTRSESTISKYAEQDIRFLRTREVKLIIAACGTVSAVYPTEITDAFPFPYTGVLRPACAAACRATKTGKIGVLGTAATINSGKPQAEIKRILPDAQVYANPCPLFVPLVENGFIDRGNLVTRLVAEQYLRPLCDVGVDTVILGCTHFPIIKGIIGDVVGAAVTLIDPGKEAARYAANLLAEKEMLSDGAARTVEYFVSDSTASFGRLASIFLNTDVPDDRVHKIEIDTV